MITYEYLDQKPIQIFWYMITQAAEWTENVQEQKNEITMNN